MDAISGLTSIVRVRANLSMFAPAEPSTTHAPDNVLWGIDGTGNVEVPVRLVVFFPYPRPVNVPSWIHNCGDNNRQRRSDSAGAKPRSTGLALEQNGHCAAHNAVDAWPARSVRGATGPGPESRHPSRGTSAQRRGIRLHLNRVGRVSRRLLDSSSTHPNRSHTTTGQLARTCDCRSASRPKQTPIGPGRAPVRTSSR
jgi:hypothetical protein